MYSSRGSSAYGQQQQPLYSAQSAYGQNLGLAYSGSSVGGPEGVSQLPMASRHSSLLSGPQEADIVTYRAHPSAGAHYGGQYSAVYGSGALGSSQQVPSVNIKGSGLSTLEGRGGYGSALPDSPKFISGDFVSSSSHEYGHKKDQLFPDKISDYSSVDRRQFSERQGGYIGRELPSEPTGRYADSIGFGHQHQLDIYDRMDRESIHRQEPMLKTQSLQSASLDGGSRQADYLATRGATVRLATPDLMPYSARRDADPRSLPVLNSSSHTGQHAPSILGAAPQRSVDDLLYAQGPLNPGYGVSLPPGRDYASGKGLHGSSLESDYRDSLSIRGIHPRIDERRDDRGGYARELDRREGDRRRDYLREREKDREREKQHERERERERERDRERERERKRILERQEKERDRERKHGPEVRHERTPPRRSKDHRGSSLSKDGRSLRRESPRQEASHRHHSPVKEKRRDYVCKVSSSSLVDVERDYLTIDKRYPRLFISPECSKVVVNWPKKNLHLSFHTPVSFEHDFVEEDRTEKKVLLNKESAEEPLISESLTTVWNAKMILMSGLSQNALAELSSERNYDGRIPHFCNMLRFAVLKKDNSFIAIGGPWNVVDGGDPSADDSSLVQTVLRYAKDVTSLDLKSCQHWNRFIEIHYDRFGKDGLFSHKEVSVLYVPDLSECLPSLNLWRDQWFAHKRAIQESDRQHDLGKEKTREKKEGLKDKELEPVKDDKNVDKLGKKKDSTSGGRDDDANKEKDGGKLKVNATGKDEDKNKKKDEITNGLDKGEVGGSLEKKKPKETSDVQTAVNAKPGKKKIVKKIVKQKVTDKKGDVENTFKQAEVGDIGEKNAKPEISRQQDHIFATPAVKTFIRKKVVKKVVAGKTAEKLDGGMHPEQTTAKDPDPSVEISKGTTDGSGTAVAQHPGKKTTVKKKVIKRVPKKKIAASEATDGTACDKDVEKDEMKVTHTENEPKIKGKQTIDAENQVKSVKSEEKVVPKAKLKARPQGNVVNSSKNEKRAEDGDKMEGNRIETQVDKQKMTSGDSPDGKREKPKEKAKNKDEKEKKDGDGNDESRKKIIRDIKEKKFPDELPRHPGLILQTKGSKDSKICSFSLSLDSLLDYTDKDTEESTFELSLFAECLYEMLQYQMGCRLLAFLQKLRTKFMLKRNQQKRRREEKSGKGSEQNSSAKRLKTDRSPARMETSKFKIQEDGDSKEIKSGRVESQEAAHPDCGTIADENADADDIQKLNQAIEMDDDDDDDDPEEDPEEEMPDASPQRDVTNEEKAEEGKIEVDAKSGELAGNETKEQRGTTKEDIVTKPKLEAENKEEYAKAEAKKMGTPVAVDKELLQAFRFFDRNRAGYIRVEDMRLIIHNLGKFLSHRDVKELVQSALLESNTGRDDRILYEKLVNMSDI